MIFVPYKDEIYTNDQIKNKKVVQLYDYNKEKNTINCRLLDANCNIITHTINLKTFIEKMKLEQSVLIDQKLLYEKLLQLEVYRLTRTQEIQASGIGKLTSTFSNAIGDIPSYTQIVNDTFKKFILGCLVQQQQQIDRYVIDAANAKGQKGILDYLWFPLIARKLFYDIPYYRNKKIENLSDYPIKFILYSPLMHILNMAYLLLEVSRIVLGILFALLCSATVVPILHYQLKPINNDANRLGSVDNSFFDDSTRPPGFSAGSRDPLKAHSTIGLK